MKAMVRTGALGLAMAATLSFTALPQTVSGQEEHRLEGNEVAIFNLAGKAEIVAGSGNAVVVQLLTGGADASDLEVEVTEIGGARALVVHYPDDRVVYPEMGRGSNTNLRVRSDGSFFSGAGGGRGDEVRISGSGRGMEAWADLRISVPRGQRLALYLAAGETTMDGVDGELVIDTGSGSVDVRRGSGNVNVDTGSGRVRVEGFGGDVIVDTGSGSVELSGVDGTDVEIDTGSGAVRGSNITATRAFRVDTGSGEVDFTGITSPDIYVDTGSGGVDLELLSDVDRLVVDTGSGGVTLRVPSSLGAEVEIDTGSGGIEMDVPVEVRSVRRNYLRGVLGDGRGSIRLDTGSGRVRLIGG